MGQQRHVIKRQTVEITLANMEAAWPIQQTLSRIFQQHFPAILDRCLSEASPADCLHRIDRLELDLGEFDNDRLEADILDRIDATLRQALREQTGNLQSAAIAQQQDEKINAHLQLFEHFVREGYLPWWADSTQRHAPEKSFTALLNSDPTALKRLLIELIQEPHCLQRLISYFENDHLNTMLVLLTSAPKDWVTSLLLILLDVQAQLQLSSAAPGSSVRATLWQSLLQVAIAGEPDISRQAGFLSAVIVRWARLQGLSHQVLAACLQQQLTSASTMNSEWLKPIKLSTQIAHTPATFAVNTISKRYSALKKQRFEQPKLTNESPTALPTADQLNGLVSYPRQLLRASISNRYTLLNIRRHVYPGHAKEPVAGNINTAQEWQTFSDTDALYINNAGLCIVWPYLESFFERLELAQNGRFHNPAAKQCAVSLLHYLATEELKPPEYLLPFNKLLCGMAIDEVFNLAEPLTAAQIEACDELLHAVIGNAPILNNMSLNGFRGSFLLRSGSLSTSAGCWLVRVDRETYDVVLDRFPWFWQWFKLPWMEYPIRVEW